ncbi:hypothetical protein CARUB_v10016293mg [Capsella rubella]|uniref:Uncharacterized protein n=1 Tax=Capsella rubella TaxID=81985 RepID=R0I8Y2_9BRAS|nr:IAA-leucine resistant 2 [Capsella rubella]EOA32963.1 hypothetical protein CARUB_v10016293mg [Capsella rubella]
MASESSAAKMLSFFYGVTGNRIVHPTHGRLSHYYPSCHMMDYVVHSMNITLCDNFDFKQANPYYHPYILRLYCGVLFWIQCLRAGNNVNALTDVQYRFLNRFLNNHPLETLAIPGPLLELFKTLCSSQPEFPHNGKVYPQIPAQPGPARRDAFMGNLLESYFLPNVPGIFALLEDLNRLFSQYPPVYPKRGRHIPVTEDAVSTFGHKTFGSHANRTEAEKWSLVSPGLQYPCEADQKLNEAFAECYNDFDFQVTAATDNLESISSFLHLKHRMTWFTQVKGVADDVAASFEGSGTLADCPPHGLVANQVMVCLSKPKNLPDPPTCIADKRATYEFSYKLKSTAFNLSPLTEAVAAFSQTHVRMFPNHPFFGTFGSKTLDHGPFWNRRPIGSSLTDDSSNLTIPSIVKQAFKSKVPAT